MPTTTNAIVISSVKYGDTSLIVKAFTHSDGLRSYLLKGVLAAKRGRLKAAHFLPLTQLEIVAVHRNKGGLEHLREVRLALPYKSIHTDVAKNALTLFLAEMLAHSIREEERNTALYGFLESGILWLDEHEEVANFHIYFLLELTRFLGFYPGSVVDGAGYFDLTEGEFLDHADSLAVISGALLRDFKCFLGINFDGISRIRLSRHDRGKLLEAVILYYELHLPGFYRPRSLQVFQDVFD